MLGKTGCGQAGPKEVASATSRPPLRGLGRPETQVADGWRGVPNALPCPDLAVIGAPDGAVGGFDHIVVARHLFRTPLTKPLGKSPHEELDHPLAGLVGRLAVDLTGLVGQHRVRPLPKPPSLPGPSRSR